MAEEEPIIPAAGSAAFVQLAADWPSWRGQLAAGRGLLDKRPMELHSIEEA